jgi:hypothetical protein
LDIRDDPPAVIGQGSPVNVKDAWRKYHASAVEMSAKTWRKYRAEQAWKVPIGPWQ